MLVGGMGGDESPCGATSHLQVAQQVEIPEPCNVSSEGENLRNGTCGVEIF